MAPYGFNIDAPQRMWLLKYSTWLNQWICSSTLFWAIVFTNMLSQAITGSQSHHVFSAHRQRTVKHQKVQEPRQRTAKPDSRLEALQWRSHDICDICCCLFWVCCRKNVGTFPCFLVGKKHPSKNHQWWCNQKEQTMVSFGWRPKGSFQPNSTNVVLLCVERRFYRAQVRNTHLFCLVHCCCSELRVTLFSLRNPASPKLKSSKIKKNPAYILQTSEHHGPKWDVKMKFELPLVESSVRLKGGQRVNESVAIGLMEENSPRGYGYQRMNT